MLKTSAKKLKNITLCPTVIKREKLIHFKVKHVFIARDQTSKTEVYPISMFTSGLLVKQIVFTYERLTFQHQLLQEILRNW